MSNDLNTIWHTSGGNNQRTGCFPQEISSQQKAIQYSFPDGVTASPIFDHDENIYIADMGGMVRSYQDKELRWETKLPHGVYASPALHPYEKILYVATMRGDLYALHPQTGNIRWQKQIPTKSDPRILSDILILPESNLIILNSWGMKYRALDAITGERALQWPSGGSPYGSASATEGEMIFGLSSIWTPSRSSHGIHLLQIDPRIKEQEHLLLAEPGSKGLQYMTIASAPVIDLKRNCIWLVVNYDNTGSIRGLLLPNFKPIFTLNFDRHILTTPTLLCDGAIVIADLHGNVLVLDPDNGETLVTYPTKTPYLLGSPICDSQDNIFIGDIEGNVHKINKNGEGNVIYACDRCIQGRLSVSPSGKLAIASMDKTVTFLS